jgi:hypothetical protein
MLWARAARHAAYLKAQRHRGGQSHKGQGVAHHTSRQVPPQLPLPCVVHHAATAASARVTSPVVMRKCHVRLSAGVERSRFSNGWATSSARLLLKTEIFGENFEEKGSK